MNQATFQVIRNEIEKIEQGTGYGSLTITIQDGGRYRIEATRSIILDCPKRVLDNLDLTTPPQNGKSK
jgi:hypothetical protein